MVTANAASSPSTPSASGDALYVNMVLKRCYGTAGPDNNTLADVEFVRTSCLDQIDTGAIRGTVVAAAVLALFITGAHFAKVDPRSPEGDLLKPISKSAWIFTILALVEASLVWIYAVTKRTFISYELNAALFIVLVIPGLTMFALIPRGTLRLIIMPFTFATGKLREFVKVASGWMSLEELWQVGALLSTPFVLVGAIPLTLIGACFYYSWYVLVSAVLQYETPSHHYYAVLWSVPWREGQDHLVRKWSEMSKAEMIKIKLVSESLHLLGLSVPITVLISLNEWSQPVDFQNTAFYWTIMAFQLILYLMFVCFTAVPFLTGIDADQLSDSIDLKAAALNCCRANPRDIICCSRRKRLTPEQSPTSLIVVAQETNTIGGPHDTHEPKEVPPDVGRGQVHDEQEPTIAISTAELESAKTYDVENPRIVIPMAVTVPVAHVVEVDDDGPPAHYSDQQWMCPNCLETTSTKVVLDDCRHAICRECLLHGSSTGSYLSHCPECGRRIEVD
jgi:hypothetical protein